jgi:hypothetical protein
MDTGELRLPLFAQPAGAAGVAPTGAPAEYASGVPFPAGHQATGSITPGHLPTHYATGDSIPTHCATGDCGTDGHRGGLPSDACAVPQPQYFPFEYSDGAPGRVPGQLADGRTLFRDGMPWHGA